MNEVSTEILRKEGSQCGFCWMLRPDADGILFLEDEDEVTAQVGVPVGVRASEIRVEVRGAREILLEARGRAVLRGELQGRVAEHLWTLHEQHVELVLRKQLRGPQV
jgi:hypothetical protein